MPAQPLSSTHPLSSNIGERIELSGHDKVNAQPYTVPRDGWFWKLTVQQKGDFTKPGMVTYVHVASAAGCCLCNSACALRGDSVLSARDLSLHNKLLNFCPVTELAKVA